jgi:uncharacterized membrane protein YcaP (DUF421 family)
MIRLMGKRTTQQLTPFEFLIVIALGSAVGDPMFYPEVPLLAALLVITVVVSLERALSLAGQRSEAIERVVEGMPRTLVVDGRLYWAGIVHENITREELFGELRRAGIEQLGQVKYACVEQSGVVSVLHHPEHAVRPGLPIVPPWDIAEPPSFGVPAAVPQGGILVCHKCGQRTTYEKGEPLRNCPACDHDQWSEAVIEVEIAKLHAEDQTQEQTRDSE